MADDLKPCPRCGSAPVVDANFCEVGQEHISCPAVLFVGTPDEQKCGVSAFGARAWNTRYTPDDDDPACTCCGGTGITYQTERRCACQPAPTLAEALDVPEVKAMVEAARPFYAAVFNDNGDVTISTGHITTADWLRLDAALARITGGGASTRGNGKQTKD